jgi:hypothetical protein
MGGSYQHLASSYDGNVVNIMDVIGVVAIITRSDPEELIGTKP